MAKTGLHWPLVYNLIQRTAGKYAPLVPQKQVHLSMVDVLTLFGCDLWHALEEEYPDQFGSLIVSDWEPPLGKKGNGG